MRHSANDCCRFSRMEEAVFVSRWMPWHGEPAMPADGRWLRAGNDGFEAAEAL